jgi:hypothetical protein
MQVCLGYNVKCIAPRYASPVRGGGLKSTHHTHIPPIVLPPPYTLHICNLHTQEKGAHLEFITRSKILLKFVELHMCMYTRAFFPSPLLPIGYPPTPRHILFFPEIFDKSDFFGSSHFLRTNSEHLRVSTGY